MLYLKKKGIDHRLTIEYIHVNLQERIKDFD